MHSCFDFEVILFPRINVFSAVALALRGLIAFKSNLVCFLSLCASQEYFLSRVLKLRCLTMKT